MKPFALLTVLLFTAPALAADVVYVSVAGEKRIAIFKLDPKDGRLTSAGEIATSGEPGALTTDSKRRFLFAALRSTGELAAFRIEPANGKLTHINTVPAGADPSFVSTNKAGKFLLAAYYVAGKVTVHGIGADGALTKEPLQIVKTKENAHAIVLDPLELAAFVPHTGPNLIYTFPWDGKKGELSPGIRRSDFATPKGTGPRHVVFHSTLWIRDIEARVAYVSNEQGGSVTMYHAIPNHINWINWHLQPVQTLSTLPADFKGTNACAEIRLHPSNRFLYVSNRGHDSIAGFQIDAKTGRLTSLGQTPTEKTPRSFDIDPSGKFLFAAGEGSGRLAGYRVDEASGKLERISTYDVGKKAWWVMALRLPGE